MLLKNHAPTKELSILLPAYNEAAQIEQCVRQVERATKVFLDSYEIIVSEDGSTDKTDLLVANMAEHNPNLYLIHSKNRLGKGKAIKNAVAKSNGAYIVFMDVDLATDLSCLPALLEAVKRNHGMAIGSRHVKGASVERGTKRTIFSLTYNLLVRLLFMDDVHDHQCGFKMMTRQVAENVLDFSKSDGYFFDTEMIVRCKQLGYPVEEVAVHWTEKGKGANSKVNPIHDGRKIGLEMLAFRLNRSK